MFYLKRATESRWDEASKLTIKVISKPCPKCRTATERDGKFDSNNYESLLKTKCIYFFFVFLLSLSSGGCMHMVCTRAGCEFEWCWVCQTEWTRDCMGTHWFG